MVKTVYVYLISLFFVLPFAGHAQKKKKNLDPVPGKERRFLSSEVLDSSGQIRCYDPYMELLGDSLRLNEKGLVLQGWKEDLYQNGKTLHKGFYKEGKANMFRNFHENGKVERVFARIDSLSSNLEVYYENGNQRSQTNFALRQVKRHSEFYENGLLKRSEEFNPKTGQLLKRKNWYPSGTLREEIALSENKPSKYQHKIYYPNGKLAESGFSYLAAGSTEMQKIGNWTLQDSTGLKKRNKSYPSFK